MKDTSWVKVINRGISQQAAWLMGTWGTFVAGRVCAFMQFYPLIGLLQTGGG